MKRAAETRGAIAGAALVLALVATGCAGRASAGAATPQGANGAGEAAFQRGLASYYSDRLAGRATASGEPYDPAALTAAHRTLPLGAVVSVARADGRSVIVRVNDRGPYAAGRVIDLSKRAAATLGMVREGVIEVWLRVIELPPAKAKRR